MAQENDSYWTLSSGVNFIDFNLKYDRFSSTGNFESENFQDDFFNTDDFNFFQ